MLILLSDGTLKEVPDDIKLSTQQKPVPALAQPASTAPKPPRIFQKIKGKAPPNPLTPVKASRQRQPKKSSTEGVPTSTGVLSCSKCGAKTDKLHSDSYCGACNNLKTIERQRRFKAACVHYKGGACPCGEARHHLIVFLRKLAGTSHTRISRLVGGVPLSEEIQAELDACHIFCRNCSLQHQFPGASPTSTIKAICARALGNACRTCGYSRCLAALEFHHMDPAGKLVTIGSRRSKGGASRTLKPQEIQQALLEASKCVLVCSNCHADAHFLERSDRYAEHARLSEELLLEPKIPEDEFPPSCPTLEH